MDYVKIIWENEKLENALDKILIEYEDKIFPSWAKDDLQGTAFDFCLDAPMQWAKQYCEDVADEIDFDFNEDELINYLIDYCKENIMQDMFMQAAEYASSSNSPINQK